MRISSQMVFGLIILTLGVGFLLESLNLINFGQILSIWWPLIIIAIALPGITNPAQNKIGPLIILGIGLILLFSQLHLVSTNIWSIFWPLIIILIGLSILINRGRPSSTELSSEKTVDILALFSGQEKRLDTKEFAGGNISAIFGGVKLDLRGATLAAGATINVFAAFGGVEILVPKEWSIVTSGTSLFGGWEDKTEKPTTAKGTLTIRGTAIFGGASVKN